jgi:hypothetical protein
MPIRRDDGKECDWCMIGINNKGAARRQRYHSFLDENKLESMPFFHDKNDAPNRPGPNSCQFKGVFFGIKKDGALNAKELA